MGGSGRSITPVALIPTSTGSGGGAPGAPTRDTVMSSAHEGTGGAEREPCATGSSVVVRTNVQVKKEAPYSGSCCTRLMYSRSAWNAVSDSPKRMCSWRMAACKGVYAAPGVTA